MIGLRGFAIGVGALPPHRNALPQSSAARRRRRVAHWPNCRQFRRPSRGIGQASKPVDAEVEPTFQIFVATYSPNLN
jgi:hypothetical protein